MYAFIHFGELCGGRVNLFYPELGFRRPLEDPLGTLDLPPPPEWGWRGGKCEFYSWLKILAICKYTAQNHLTHPNRGGRREERKEKRDCIARD